MADIQKVINLLFSGTDDTGSAIRSITSGLDRVEDAAETVGGSFEDIGAPFLSAAKDVAVLEAAILAVGLAGLKARSDIEAEAVRMGDALNVPTEKAAEFEEVAKRVYGSGFGGDLAESFATVTSAAQKFSDETAAGIEAIVTDANKLNATFGVETADSLSVVKRLTDDFGISAKAAFDLVTAGYQDGLNGSGDFASTITEYSTQFANGGASAEQFFSVMKSGFQEGYLGTDKAADAFKEFVGRIQDGSSTTADALAQLGLGDEFVDSLATGKTTAIEAFGTVIKLLNEADSSTIQLQAGSGLLGEQFLDLGKNAALGLSTTAVAIDDVAGRIDAIDPAEGLGVKFKALFNTIITALTGDEVWGQVEQDLKSRFDGFRELFSEAWADLDEGDFQGLIDSVYSMFDSIGAIFDGADIDLSTSEGIKTAIQDLIDTVKSLNEVAGGIADFSAPIVSGIANVVRSFNELDDDTKNLIGQIVGAGSALSVLGGVLAAGGAVVGGISSLAGLLSAGGALATGLGVIVAILTGPLGLAVALGAVGAAVLGFSMGSMTEEADKTRDALESEIKLIDELTDRINALPDTLTTVEIYASLETGDYDETLKLLEESEEKARIISVKAEVEQKEFNDFWENLVDLPPLTTAEIEAVANSASLSAVATDLDELAKTRQAEVDVNANTAPATETIQVWSESQGNYEIEVPVNATGIDEATAKIKEIPTEKQVEIKLQGDIDTELARIEQTGETLRSSFEWTAKVNIAQAQADAETLTATYSALSTTIASTGDVISSAFGALDSDSAGVRQEAERALRKEYEYREEALAQQKILNTAQAEYLEARTKALESGDMEIKISSDGLEPALELIWYQIMQKVQVKVSETGADVLLGIV